MNIVVCEKVVTDPCYKGPSIILLECDNECGFNSMWDSSTYHNRSIQTLFLSTRQQLTKCSPWQQYTHLSFFFLKVCSKQGEPGLINRKQDLPLLLQSEYSGRHVPPPKPYNAGNKWQTFVRVMCPQTNFLQLFPYSFLNQYLWYKGHLHNRHLTAYYANVWDKWTRQIRTFVCQQPAHLPLDV